MKTEHGILGIVDSQTVTICRILGAMTTQYQFPFYNLRVSFDTVLKLETEIIVIITGGNSVRDIFLVNNRMVVCIMDILYPGCQRIRARDLHPFITD